MIELNDENLNKYLDGDLRAEDSKSLKILLQNSKTYNKKFEALKKVHYQLEKIKEDEVSPGFTATLMKRLPYKFKPKRSDKYFVVSISTILFAVVLVILGFVIGSSLDSFQQSSYNNGFIDTLDFYLSFVSDFTVKLFSPKNISVFGSVISLLILILGYFLFDSFKHSKENF